MSEKPVAKQNQKPAVKVVSKPEQPHTCEFEPGCKEPARKLVGALLHRGPDGVARVWICDGHFSKLQLAPPFSMMSVLKILPK